MSNSNAFIALAGTAEADRRTRGYDAIAKNARPTTPDKNVRANPRICVYMPGHISIALS